MQRQKRVKQRVRGIVIREREGERQRDSTKGETRQENGRGTKETNRGRGEGVTEGSENKASAQH